MLESIKVLLVSDFPKEGSMEGVWMDILEGHMREGIGILNNQPFGNTGFHVGQIVRYRAFDPNHKPVIIGSFPLERIMLERDDLVLKYGQWLVQVAKTRTMLGKVMIYNPKSLDKNLLVLSGEKCKILDVIPDSQNPKYEEQYTVRLLTGTGEQIQARHSELDEVSEDDIPCVTCDGKGHLGSISVGQYRITCFNCLGSGRRKLSELGEA